MKNIIIINFKTYENAVGEKALALAKICEQAAIETGCNIMVAVGAADVCKISSSVKIPVLSQHCDSSAYGAHTGSILAESIKANGGFGTLLNHSEMRIRLDFLQATVIRCKQAGLFTVVCANDAIQGEALSLLGSDAVAVEPPELISGNISVTSANPEVVLESVRRIRSHSNSPLILIGAGIKSGADVSKAKELGCDGVLLASGVTNAADPEKALRDLVAGFITT